MIRAAVCSLVLASCGNEPLIGSWVSNDIGEFGSFVDSLQQQLDMSAGKKLRARSTAKYKASSGVFPGCIETTALTGSYALSGPKEDQYIVFQYDGGTVVRAMCMNMSDNTAERPASDAETKNASRIVGSVKLFDSSFVITVPYTNPGEVMERSALYTFNKI